MPGLTDAHIHLQNYSLGLAKVDCETETKEECLRRVAERVKTTKPGEWVLGHGWNQNESSGGGVVAHGTENSMPIAPNNPVYLTAKSCTPRWANTAAMKLANITNETPNPQNGAIQRDAKGKATGILLETAMELVVARIPEPTLTILTMPLKKPNPFYGKWD